MKKSYEKKTAELRKEISLALSSKNRILSDIIMLNNKFNNSVINERDYNRELNKRYQGRTKHELLDFLDSHISKSKRKLGIYENKIRKTRTQQNLGIPLSLLLILFLAVGFFVFKPAFTGYATVTSTANYTQALDLELNFSTEHTWFLEHPGNLRSIRLDGEVSKDGYAQVYLVHNNVKYVIFDSDLLEEEGLTGITGLVIANETDIVNETTANETAVLNETIIEINQTEAIINETIPLNETNETTTLNETNQTITNETIINATINETEPIDNQSIIDKTITISLEYKSGTIYDPDDDGVEAIDGITDFTVENSEFNWDVDFSKLCTKWETYSIDNNDITTVCYGADTCCAFISMMPTSLVWNESFLSAYEHHGASYENIISSQILYVDYNVSLENPYTDIHNSEWQSLNASFSEKKIRFNDFCVDTCLLDGFNETFYTLMFNVSNARLLIETVDYSILEEIENITLVNITNITVVQEEVKQYKAVIGRPVRWKKTIKLANETDKLSITLPKDVTNVSVKKIINQTIKEDVENVKIKSEGVINDVDAYNLITGAVVYSGAGENILSKFFNWLSKFFNWFSGITGFAIADVDNSTELIIEENVTEVEIEYETKAPEAFEEEINYYKKRIIVSSEIHYTDILTYTYLPIEAQESSINLYWVNDSGKGSVSFDAYDTDSNGLMDFIEWITPSLSNQTYEVEITILNVQSYPMVMGYWTVMFNTTGIANLTIMSFNRTNYTEMGINNPNTTNDLELTELRCGNQTLQPYYLVDLYEEVVSEIINETNITIINATNITLINMSETNVSEHIQNLTLLNATINETIINETVVINETIPLNETNITVINETNVTVINATIPLNETSQTIINETIPINETTNETSIIITGSVILNETIIEINQTTINETNMTLINATINETAVLNETIPINETNQTITNETIINETAILNETNITVINVTIPINETNQTITNETVVNATLALATTTEINGKTYYIMTKEEIENNSYKIKGITYPDYECTNTGYHTVRVLTYGKHSQLFMFGTQSAYAYNVAGDNPPQSNGTFIGTQLDILTTGLVSYWEFEDSSEDTMNVHNGTAIGAVNTSGRVGMAYGFNGSGSYVNVSDTDSLNMTDDISIEFWFRPDQAYDTKNASFVYIEDGYEVYMKNDKVIFSYGTDTVNTPARVWSSGQWYYVVAISDGITMYLYIDGEGEVAYDFYIQNDAGLPVAKFSSTGDIVLKGACSAGTCEYPTDNQGLVIQDSGGDTVAYINSTGDFCIEDSDCDDNDASCDDAGDGSFILQNTEGGIVSYIDSTGALCLKGLLTENGSP